jgi:hypothetical protein
MISTPSIQRHNYIRYHALHEAEYDRVSIMVDGVIEALDTPKN